VEARREKSVEISQSFALETRTITPFFPRLFMTMNSI